MCCDHSVDQSFINDVINVAVFHRSHSSLLSCVVQFPMRPATFVMYSIWNVFHVFKCTFVHSSTSAVFSNGSNWYHCIFSVEEIFSQISIKCNFLEYTFQWKRLLIKRGKQENSTIKYLNAIHAEDTRTNFATAIVCSAQLWMKNVL